MVNFSLHHEQNDSFTSKTHTSEKLSNHWIDIQNSNATITIFFESSDALKDFVKTVSNTELE